MSKFIFPEQVKIENQGTNYIDQKIQSGNYFSGSLTRNSIVPETFYRVIKTGGVPLIIESIIDYVNYLSSPTGELSLQTRIYIDISNSNSWTYSGGSTVKVGKPLSVELINSAPEFDVVESPTIDTLTGDFDFIVGSSQYFVDTASLVGIASSMFNADRKLIIPANSEVLVESISSGTALVAGDITTFINAIEPGDY